MKKDKLGLRLEWTPHRCERGWLDTFVFRISATDGLPPAAQAKIIEGIAKKLGMLRYTANLHVTVDSPGKWFINEINRVCDPVIPLVITWEGEDFVTRGYQGSSATIWAALEPPCFSLLEVNNIRSLKRKDRSKLRVLRIMARLGQAHSIELASLSGYSKVYVLKLMKSMADEKLVMRSTIGNYAGWDITRKGVSATHLSWNLPTGMKFTRDRQENNYAGWQHHRASRMLPEWLKKSWRTSLELWECWTEIYLKPGGYPDALAWGKYKGEEMLFWLEVDTGHMGYKTMIKKYQHRWQNAAQYAKTAGLKIVFVLLAPPWVANRSRDAFIGLPDHLAAITHEWGDFGTLPYPRFGWWVSKLATIGWNEPYQSMRRKGNRLSFDPNQYR